MKLNLHIYALSFGFLFHSGSFAIEGIATNEELDKREQEAMELVSETTQISETYGRLIVVRDNHLFGKNGIQDKYNSCLVKMSS